MSEQVLVQFRMDKELKQEVSEIYEELGMNKAEFIRWAYEELKKQKNIDKISK